MCAILVFFGENVGNVLRSRYVIDCNLFALYRLTDSVVSQLNMSNCSCCSVLTPLHTCHVVVVNGNGVFEECVFQLELCEYLTNICELTDAFVRGIDLSLC